MGNLTRIREELLYATMLIIIRNTNKLTASNLSGSNLSSKASRLQSRRMKFQFAAIPNHHYVAPYLMRQGPVAALAKAQ